MKSINLIVDDDAEELYDIFINRKLNYGQDYILGLVKAAGFSSDDGLQRIFVSFRHNGKYVVYNVLSNKEIHGSYKVDVDEEVVKSGALFYGGINPGENLFITDREAGKIIDKLFGKTVEKVYR